MAKTYNSGYSLVVTHLTTNPPVRCLNRAERTGSLVFNVLWSYVEGRFYHTIILCVTAHSLSHVELCTGTLNDEQIAVYEVSSMSSPRNLSFANE
jgi:hypothetical protein